jgi:D-alanine transaminase
MQVYLNGSFLDHADAVVSVDDRGFLFADGVYEVIRLYSGQPFLTDPHLTRMRNGLAALRIDTSAVDEVARVLPDVIGMNDVSDDGMVYIQVTRGVAPRKHAFPKDAKPTVYMFAKPFTQYPAEFFAQGVAAITVPETRWSRCDIKSIALLPNVLANQQAHENGAFEALFVKEGVIIEGSHSNLFAVLDDTLVTYPSCNYILSGITRALVLDIAHEAGIPVRMGGLYVEQLGDVQEMFVSGTTTEIMPIRTLDGKPIGAGRRGAITERIQEAYAARVQQLLEQAAVATR